VSFLTEDIFNNFYQRTLFPMTPDPLYGFQNKDTATMAFIHHDYFLQ